MSCIDSEETLLEPRDTRLIDRLVPRYHNLFTFPNNCVMGRGAYAPPPPPPPSQRRPRRYRRHRYYCHYPHYRPLPAGSPLDPSLTVPRRRRRCYPRPGRSKLRLGPRPTMWPRSRIRAPPRSCAALLAVLLQPKVSMSPPRLLPLENFVIHANRHFITMVVPHKESHRRSHV